MEQYQKHHQEHTHVLEDGTVVTHSHGHTHSHAHTKAVLNRLPAQSAIWNLFAVW